MLEKIFDDIKNNKKFYSDSRNGIDFEEKFKNTLKGHGFSEIVQRNKTISAIKEIANIEKIKEKTSEEYYKKIKDKILLKNSLQIEKNPFNNIKNSFIFQPYGSQQFPDFIIFTKNYILPIEIKYSQNKNRKINFKNARPMWNSNIPKANSIYIYGVSNEVVTFFMGSSILDYNTREHLLDFFKNMKKGGKEWNTKLNEMKNNFGIYPYIRKAYEHKSTKSTYIKGKKIVESYFSENAINRENNVIKFLKSLSKTK